jgi:hypothetical protein
VDPAASITAEALRHLGPGEDSAAVTKASSVTWLTPIEIRVTAVGKQALAGRLSCIGGRP